MPQSHCEQTILVVDDDKGIREALCEVLSDDCYKTQIATNGRDALQLLEQDAQKPCVILLDIMMPIMDGWAFLAEQQSRPELKDIPIIILSAHAKRPNLQQWGDKLAYLGKPVELDPLLDMVHGLCDIPRMDTV